MSAALVLRGYAHGHRADWRKCVATHREKLIGPLRAKYGRCDVMLATYDLPPQVKDELKADYQPDVCSMVPEGPTQPQTMVRALGLVESIQQCLGVYEFVVVSRFDLEILTTPWEWESENFKPDCVNFLWREWNDMAWDDHHRVPDAIHMLPGQLVDGFCRGVMAAPSTVCMHLVYWPTARVIGEERLNVMHKGGCCDSNTDVQPNPVYRIIRC